MLGEGTGEHARGRRVRLGPALAVAITWGVIVLLLSADAISVGAWPLISVPIVLSGVLLAVPGAIVTGALSALAAFLVLDGLSVAVWVGIGTFTAVAVGAGIHVAQVEARLARLEASSAIDAKTGVYTRSHFRLRIEEEARRSVRYRDPFGVIRVSIAGYEGFVRKFGTFKGTAMLARLAQVVRVAVRDSDVVGRLGDHDIGILLPHSRIEECQAVAARVVDVVANTSFEGDAVEPFVTAEARTAWAVYPEEAANVGALLEVLQERIAPKDALPNPESGDR